MEGFNPQNYRDNLAKDLKDIRKENPEKAQKVLAEEQQTTRYKEAEDVHSKERSVIQEESQKKKLREEIKELTQKTEALKEEIKDALAKNNFSHAETLIHDLKQVSKNLLERKEKENPYLKLIATTTLPPLQGGEKANIYNMGYTFDRIDSSFKEWGLDTPQPKTEETSVSVYEMYRSGDFQEIFTSLNKDLKSLAFKSQEQIIEYCKKNKDLLASNNTFFLFTEEVDGKEEFFVAYARHRSRGGVGANVNVYRLSHGGVWDAGYALRLAVPATESLNDSDKNPSETSERS